MDLRTPVNAIIKAHNSIVIDTGVHMDIPKGFYGKIEAKSGLNVKHNIVSFGGTIDSGYTGSIAVKLYNMGDKDYSFIEGDKIAQIVIQPCLIGGTRIVETLDKFEPSERGGHGFGSTGR